MPRMVCWRDGRVATDEGREDEDGPWSRAFWSRVLIVSRGYRERSTVRPAIAPEIKDLVHSKETNGSGSVSLLLIADEFEVECLM